MLKKLLKVHKPTHFSPNPPPAAAQVPAEENSSALKIVHAGGSVECYYMAIPAVRIMDKYPSFMLTKPEIFHRPWDSIVKPDQILTPGEKYFIVSDRTVRKLQRRIRKPNGAISSANLGESREKPVRRKKCESKKEKPFSSVNVKHKDKEKPFSVGRSRLRFTPSASWQPSLATVTETHGFNE